MSLFSCFSFLCPASGFLAVVLAVAPWNATGLPHPTEEQVRQQLSEVFSRPEFSPGKPEKNWLLEALVHFFQWLGTLQAANPFLFWVLLIGCILLLLLIVGHLVWTVRRVLFVGSRLSGDKKAHERRRRLSAGYFEEARRRAAQGDFTEAVRFLFLSLVYRFDESGRVSFQQAYTNREYLALFEDRPPVFRELKVFVDFLDDHWYGQRATDQRRYEQCLALYEQLQ